METCEASFACEKEECFPLRCTDTKACEETRDEQGENKQQREKKKSKIHGREDMVQLKGEDSRGNQKTLGKGCPRENHRADHEGTQRPSQRWKKS